MELTDAPGHWAACWLYAEKPGAEKPGAEKPEAETAV
jgi:hypothetical protein